jgi:hypothetical protein
MVPDPPVQIIANGSSSAPAAPPQTIGNGSGSSPSAPVQVVANASGSGPAAPGQIIDNAHATSGGIEGSILITGDARVSGGEFDQQSINGVYLPTSFIYNDKPTYTIDGNWGSGGGDFNVTISYELTVGWDIKAKDGVSLITNWDVGAAGDEDTPVGLTYGGHSGGDGTPTVSAVGTVLAPVQVVANGSGSSPAAPPAVIA